MALGSNVPAAVANAIQQGFLKEEFERALKGRRAYALCASPEPVRCRKGNTLTLTRESGLAPKTAPISQSGKSSNLDNGLSSDVFSIEQYTLTMNEYAATADLNLLDDEVVIANQAFTYARAQGEQAMSTLEGLARSALLNAGMAGNTRIINNSGGGLGNDGAPATTHCQVDDIRGFQYVLVSGVKTPVSGTNTLSVSEIANGGSGVTQTLTVTGVAVDTTNVSSALAVGGISGVLTFNSATLPVAGDIMIAANSSTMIRPNGRLATHLLTAQDVFTTGAAFDMSVCLDNNGVPRFGDDYLCFVSPTSHRQLFADPSFERAYQGQYDADTMRKGVLTSHQGITYVKTNFALRQAAGSGVTVNVERPIMVGKDVLIRGDFEGLEQFVARKGTSEVHQMELIDGVIFNIRDALDRAGQFVAMTWDTVIDFQVPTDLGTTNLIIPTATNALFKRIVVAEHSA